MAQQGVGRESVRGPARSGASDSPARRGSAAFLVPVFSHGLFSCRWRLPNVLASLSRRAHPLSTCSVPISGPAATGRRTLLRLTRRCLRSTRHLAALLPPGEPRPQPP